MPTAGPELLVATLALIGAVIVVSALLSCIADKGGFPQVAVFLALGAIIGAPGLGWVDATPESPILQAVATLSLALVLFTDAVSLNMKEVRTHKFLASLVLGPGTMLTAFLVAAAAWWLLDFSPAMAAILGAALASTDPVLLRSLLRNRGLDSSVRQALRLESGLNDAILLPVVLVAMALLVGAGSSDQTGWGTLLIRMLVLTPAIGVAVSLAAIGVLELIRRTAGVRRDYESMYSLGIALVAYAAAESVHGSGFLAAFAAGLTIAALDLELCDCFLEYGETTGEMCLMFTFVLLGTSIMWTSLDILAPATVLFTLAVVILRPLAFIPALIPAKLTNRNRALIAWYGPRGLSSLLLVLLPVFAGVPGSQQLLPICCLVVLFSVVVHGLSPALVFRNAAAAADAQPVVFPQAVGAVAAASSSAPVISASQPAPLVPRDPEFITVDEFKQIQAGGMPVTLVDVRSERSYHASRHVLPGAVRLLPGSAVDGVQRFGLPRESLIALFCS